MLVVGTEECDDGNTNSGDGCSSTCLNEPGGGGGGTNTTCSDMDNDGVCDTTGTDPRSCSQVLNNRVS